MSMRLTSFGAGPSSPLVQEQWLRDITCIRTGAGFLCLAVILDLFLRRVIGGSIQGRTHTDLPLQALLMAVWRRKPKTKVHVHSPSQGLQANERGNGSGSQITVSGWQAFLEQHNLAPGMSRRGTCSDNALPESGTALMATGAASPRW